MGGIGIKYSKLLVTNPYSTKMLTSAALSCSADVIVQKIITQKEIWDIRRTISVSVTGALFVPFWHNCYKYHPGIAVKSLELLNINPTKIRIVFMRML